MIEYEFPLYLVAGVFAADPVERSLSLKDPLTVREPAAPLRLAIFTSRATAEQARDGAAADLRVFDLATPDMLVLLLRAMRTVAPAVAFDPYQPDVTATVVPTDEVLARHTTVAGTPD